MTRARPEAQPTSFDAAGRPILRCAIYTRQSVARGEQDLTSCDVQRERCEDYVRAMQYEGWVALEERFDDLGVSGGGLERPALRRLLSWCVQGRVDVVVVTSLDRLARKMADWVRLNDWLKQAGVELAILQGAGGARGPLAELVNKVVASLAELRAASRSRPSDSHLRCSRPVSSLRSEAVVERDIISERLPEAKGRARARGRRAAGRVPLGYDADPSTRQLVIDNDEAALVRAFFERCAAGESGASIAAWAKEAGHRTKVHGGKGGAAWTGRSVLQVVRNPIYLGRRTHREGTVEGVHDAIVDEDLARRAFTALDARRTREPSPRSKAPEWDQDPWMLRGLLRCTGCGRACSRCFARPTSPGSATTARAAYSRRSRPRGRHGSATTLGPATRWCAGSCGRPSGTANSA